MAAPREAAPGHLPTYAPNLRCAGQRAGSDMVPDLGEHVAQDGQIHRHIDPRKRCYRRAEPGTASLAQKHWEGAFELILKR